MDFEETHTTIFIAVVVVLVSVIFLALGRRGRSAPALTVTELNLYPVKSCSEIRVKKATVTPRGFKNDRIAQVSDKDGKYCTPRDAEKSKLFKVTTAISSRGLVLKAPGMRHQFDLDMISAPTTPTTVEAMESPNTKLRDYGDDVASWLEEATGIAGCRLTGIGDDYNRSVKVNPDQGDAIPSPNSAAPVSLADEAPFLLTSATSLADLNRRLVSRGKDLVDMRRFRPNIVIRGLRPWEEDTLKRIRIGAVEFWVWQRCGRCTMTTINRDSLERSGEPLSTLSTFRERKNGQRNFGMHLIPVTASIKEGTDQISVGDTVEILEYDDDRRAEWMRLFATDLLIE